MRHDRTLRNNWSGCRFHQMTMRWLTLKVLPSCWRLKIVWPHNGYGSARSLGRLWWSSFRCFRVAPSQWVVAIHKVGFRCSGQELFGVRWHRKCSGWRWRRSSSKRHLSWGWKVRAHRRARARRGWRWRLTWPAYRKGLSFAHFHVNVTFEKIYIIWNMFYRTKISYTQYSLAHRQSPKTQWIQTNNNVISSTNSRLGSWIID